MSSTSVTSFVLPESITTQAGCEYQLRKIQAFLENKTGLSSPRSIDVALVIGEVTYDYPLPAGYGFITVFLEDRQVEVEQSSGSFLALFNALHKGRYSGAAWSWLIDISAIINGVIYLNGDHYSISKC